MNGTKLDAETADFRDQESVARSQESGVRNQESGVSSFAF